MDLTDTSVKYWEKKPPKISDKQMSQSEPCLLVSRRDRDAVITNGCLVSELTRTSVKP